MNQRSKLRLCILGAVVATAAVFAGGYVALEPQPLQGTAEGTTAITANETLVTTIEPLRPEPVIAPEPADIPATAIVPVQAAEPAPDIPAQPAITVTEQRLTEDQRIQLQVMDALARNTTLSGKVGVEARDQVVNLSGYLMTNGQVMRAGREAGSVMGVRYVVNEIRPRVGPITN
jgi:hypothetical protein